MKPHLIIHGAAGRMGQALLKHAPLLGFHIDAAIDRPDHPNLGQSLGPNLRLEGHLKPRLEAWTASQYPKVLIDFSTAQAAAQAIEWASQYGIPVVSGTTGWSHEEHWTQLAIPLLIAPNMSIGINLLSMLIEQAAKTLDSWDMEVFEIHHRHKKDSPSGTAKALAQVLSQDRRTIREGRSGLHALRQKDEIGISAARGGDVVGEHTVFFLGEGERLELTHRATDRKIFALGALRAATWIVHQSPGLYSMKDVLQ